jgi:hypothetical protein
MEISKLIWGFEVLGIIYHIEIGGKWSLLIPPLLNEFKWIWIFHGKFLQESHVQERPMALVACKFCESCMDSEEQ